MWVLPEQWEDMQNEILAARLVAGLAQRQLATLKAPRPARCRTDATVRALEAKVREGAERVAVLEATVQASLERERSLQRAVRTLEQEIKKLVQSHADEMQRAHILANNQEFALNFVTHQLRVARAALERKQ